MRSFIREQPLVAAGWNVTRKTQKCRELAALAYVYDITSFDEIVPDDPPDFRVRLRGEAAMFGVEVVDFFADETQARVLEIPGYVEDLIGGKDVRHKDDRNVLSVGQFEVIEPDDTIARRTLTGVIREGRSSEETASLLARRITEKRRKAATCHDGLSHQNLIVCDHERLLSHVLPRDFYSVYCTEIMRSAVLASVFREVFLVTRKGDEWGFIPLRRLVFLAELKLFARAESQAHRSPEEPTRDGILRFARYFDQISYGSVYVRDTSDGTEIIHGDCALVVSNDNTLRLKTFADRDFSASGLAVTHGDHAEDNATISASIRSYRVSRSFVCDLWTASPKADGNQILV